ncbi:hypothetical protein SAMN05192583_1872 [Sphingomonas gellani]|uniref:Lipoprotein n=1 Tax=Sphingomonas gellani TaxID=1166340 RepID=A0A1H8DCF5_9SPHN|nr:hypothetical protein [Sphingomonas gellani]SEN04836.1 hypothetical protein SAMN05192583_1872 [Sphingomonas gellani]
MRMKVLAVSVVLAGCGPTPSNHADRNRSDAVAPVTANATVTELPAAKEASGSTPAQGTQSCRDEIGPAAAGRLAAQCRAASPATRPPCNVANSCSMIRDEIERSCKLFADTDPLPADLCPTQGAATATTPVSVVRAYYSAIAAHDYGRAYRLWRDEGRASGKSLADFTRGFADTADTSVDPGTPSDPEDAAGSTYVTLPVTVQATTRSGARQRFRGSYVLRRANDVPGASAVDRSWRIDSATLKPVG